MDFDKTYVLQTGVTVKVSAGTLRQLIASALDKQEFSGLKNVRSTPDLHEYLSVVICSGAEELIQRRQRWLDPEIEADLMAGRPVSFVGFCNLFWRNLDEEDPDGDEWQRIIASDSFHAQLTALLRQLRIAENSLQYKTKEFSGLYLGACRT